LSADEVFPVLSSVIFDLDGVIINSEPLMRYAFSVCYRQVVGEGTPPTERFLEHMGESFPHILKQLELPLSLWEPYRKLCQSHIEQIRVFSGAREGLEWLRCQDIRMAILTGKDRERTEQILAYFDLEHFFTTVLSSDELNNPKPHPEGIQLLLKRLESDAKDTVMVGDGVSDILCAQNAGVRSIAALWGTKPERLRQFSRPDYFASDWADLTRRLQALL
jgi:3-amino-5-hydroxybenzoic acid synthesis related protein